MKELKKILIQIVEDLERSALALEVLNSGATDKRSAKELAFQKNQEFYNSLRKQIDALP